MRHFQYIMCIMFCLTMMPMTLSGQELIELESDTISTIKLASSLYTNHFDIDSDLRPTLNALDFTWNNMSMLTIQGYGKNIGIKKRYPNTDLHILQPPHAKIIYPSEEKIEAISAGITLEGKSTEIYQQLSGTFYPKWRIYIDADQNLAFTFNGDQRAYIRSDLNVGALDLSSSKTTETKSYSNQEVIGLIEKQNKKIAELEKRLRDLEEQD